MDEMFNQQYYEEIRDERELRRIEGDNESCGYVPQDEEEE